MLIQERRLEAPAAHGPEFGTERWWWWCRGCDLERRMPGDSQGMGLHVFDARWTYDGNPEAPTFAPSFLARSNWAGRPTVCHSFIRAGMIEYLADSTHALAGQTVPMVDIPAGWIDG